MLIFLLEMSFDYKIKELCQEKPEIIALLASSHSWLMKIGFHEVAFQMAALVKSALSHIYEEWGNK